MTDTWEPAQYHRFAAERRQPFFDLLALVDPAPDGQAVDLGCGTGELTVDLHRHLGAAATVGIDSSPAMLEKAAPHSGGGVSFVHGDIAEFPAPVDGDGPGDGPEGPYDVVFANASLQWLDDHPGLLARLARAVRPGGQLAAQVPANYDFVTHTLACELGADYGVPGPRSGAVLAPEEYAAVLHRLGFVDQHVRLQVYAHVLESSDDVVEWARGTLLTQYRKALAPDTYEEFLAAYRARLVSELGDERPFFYPFKRILFRARRPA